VTLTYDQLPYDSFPVPHSHPDALSAIARLFGLRPADVPTCRVLELGCGTGANLVPMAAAFPKARFVGVDLSPVQIDQGRVEARASGASNLELVAADLTTWAAPAAEPFDFVIAHGVFSWVPREVQEALLAQVKKSLAPQGVAYVSYSALPGDHPRQALREMLGWSVRGVSDPKEKVARARHFAGVLGRHLPDRAPGSAALRRFVAEVGAMSDSYVLHDLLADTHEAISLTSFARRAQAHGLSYLGDAQLHAMFAGDLEEEVVEALRASATDQASFEEGMDLFTQRPFRTSLLCHAEAPVRRDLSWDRLEDLHLSTLAQARGQEDGHWLFRAPGGQVFGSPDPLVGSMLTQLVHHRPAPVPFAELCDLARAQVDGAKATAADREILGMNLLAALGAGQVTAGTCDRSIRADAGGEKPVAALASARRQAASQGWATNLWHQRVDLDPDQRRLLPLLDGTRSRAALVAEAKENELWLEAHLASLAELAFLVSNP
jgi:SAM-dependent methyltransferase